MIKFLIKGLLRDRHRSLFPVIIVSAGVFICVLLYCFMHGFIADMVRTNAKMDTGHVKIMTRAYKEIANQVPNDLALFNVSERIKNLEKEYPKLDWTPRIKFGGLLDFPNKEGETLVQAPVFGMGLDLLSEDTKEIERLNLEKGLVRGRLPEKPNEAIVSDEFLEKLERNIGDTATLISSTAYGGMAVYNFEIVGTVHFGVAAMDRNAIIADIEGVRQALYMEDGAGEVLGFFPNLVYHENRAEQIAMEFNRQQKNPDDKFSPVMITLRQQNGLGDYLDMGRQRIGIIVGVFVFVMSIVLWNTGLMSGLRRYGEFGVRLAIGESKWHVYRTWIYETLAIGLVGSIIGTAIGLGISYYLQEVGWDISNMMNEFTMLMSNVIRAKITTFSYFIGFIPGFLATFVGAAISGIGIFKRETSQLFKELEA